jgi:phage replication-related protein YjqB (UPF0714/DUF867 family)
VRRDNYCNFSELAANEQRGRDYAVIVVPRDSDTTIIAPHGGGIEPGASELAEAIAGSEFSLYRFEGLKSNDNEALHITSTYFDEPECLRMVEASQRAIAIHGCDDEDEIVYVGGLDEEQKTRIITALVRKGFKAEIDDSNHSGSYSENICNRGLRRSGLQLEISKGLRSTMFGGLSRRERRQRKQPFNDFVVAVREVLL